MELHGRVALVTGGAGGIGGAVARRLANSRFERNRGQLSQFRERSRGIGQ